MRLIIALLRGAFSRTGQRALSIAFRLTGALLIIISILGAINGSWVWWMLLGGIGLVLLGLLVKPREAIEE